MRDFKSLFDHALVVKANAPGRVNLIGEHTDYNGGFVLPTAIPQRTHVELAPGQRQTIRVCSDALTRTTDIQTYTLGAEKPGRDWLDYVQGGTQLLAREGFRLAGFDARVGTT